MASKASSTRLAERGLRDIDALIREIVAEYKSTQASIESIVYAALLSGKLGQLRFRRNRSATVLRALAQLEAATKKPASTIVKEAFRLGTRVADRDLPTSNLKGLSRVNSEAVSLLLDNLDNRLGDARITIGRRSDDVFRREGLRMAAAQITRERSIPEATQQLVQRLTEQGITSFQDTAGRRWKLDAYSNMVVRTTVAEALFNGTQTRMIAGGFDLVKVNRSKEACPVCRPYEGKTFSLTGRADGYPQLDVTFPLHPHCDHFITPAPEAVKEREEALGRVG